MTLPLHQRWFVDAPGPPIHWAALTEAPTLIALGTAATVAALVTGAWRRFRHRPLLRGPRSLGATEDQLSVVYGWVPLVLAVHTAVPLVVSGVQNQLFVPNLLMELDVGAFVGLAEVGVGLLLFYGVIARYAALGLPAIWLAGVAMFGPVLLLEHVLFLGIAAFFWIVGRGPVALDRIFGSWARADQERLHLAVPVLRLSVGFSIAWLALSEKLLNLPLGLAFVEAYPFVNFTPALGFPVSDATFIRAAGTVELTAGLLLLSGAFPRLVILLLWLPFNLTLTAFGWQELVGHLPIYAIIAVILLWGSGGDRDVKAFRAGLASPWSEPRDEPESVE